MATSVRIEDKAFSDSRFDVLAQLCGLPDADCARGKMMRLWRQCTIEQSYDLHPIQVDTVLGEFGSANIVASHLGEHLRNDRIRICGTAGRIEWAENLQKGSAKGGQVRAATAKRDSLGRMVAGPAESSRSAGQPHQHPSSVPSPSPSPSPSPIQLPSQITRENGDCVLSAEQVLALGQSEHGWRPPTGTATPALLAVCPVRRDELDAAIATTKATASKPGFGYLASVLASNREAAQRAPPARKAKLTQAEHDAIAAERFDAELLKRAEEASR
jgi:hypothetical protein